MDPIKPIRAATIPKPEEPGPCRARLIAIATGIVGSAYAEDVVQDVLLRRVGLTPGALSQAVRHASISVWRKEQVETRTRQGGGRGESTYGDDPSLEIDMKRLCCKLHDPLDRKIVHALLEGQTVREIAQGCKLPRTTMGRRIARVRQLLKDLL